MEFKPINNMKLDSSIKDVEKSLSDVDDELNATSIAIGENTSKLEGLESRVAVLTNKLGLKIKTSSPEKDCNTTTAIEYAPEPIKDYRLDNLNGIDITMTCIAGGVAVLVDFLIVKIPKTSQIVRNGKTITQEGSPMTAVLRKIGFKSNGKTSKWVGTLEKFFKVNYDTSTIKGEKGFNPSSHRIYSLAHDPSPSGLLWALKDAICGTMTYIDKDGVLKSIPTKNVSAWKVLAMPIIWIGHIISDIFTKAGVPLPGACFLRTLQLGSFGAKKRTISEVVSYMYYEGYDLRHLVTMLSTNACIEIILRIYHILTREHVEQFMRPTAIIEAQQSMIKHRLEKMRLGAYAIACGGNVAKLAIYQWNPNALNLTVWLEFLRTAISEYERTHSTEQDVVNIVVLRQEIEDKFKRMENKLKSL